MYTEMPFWLAEKIPVPTVLSKNVEVRLLQRNSTSEVYTVDDIFTEQLGRCATYSEVAEMIDASGNHLSVCIVAVDRKSQHVLGACLFSIPLLGIDAGCTIYSLATSMYHYGDNRGVGSLLLLSTLNYIKKHTIYDYVDLESTVQGEHLYKSYRMLSTEPLQYSISMPFASAVEKAILRKKKKYGKRFDGEVYKLRVTYLYQDEYTKLHYIRSEHGTIVLKQLPDIYCRAGAKFDAKLYLLCALKSFREKESHYGIYFSEKEYAAYRIQNAYKRYTQRKSAPRISHKDFIRFSL